jgi:hypothetical protein
MVELNVVLQTVSALGVMIALFYYAITIRNTEKTRRKDFIFQSNLARTPEYFDIFHMVDNQMWDYETLEEYYAKYSDEQITRHNYLYCYFNVIGAIYKEKVASLDEIFQLYPSHSTISLFEISWPLIRDVRARSNSEWLKPFELLYEEAKKRNPEYVPYWRQKISPTRAYSP